jgi:hypothetical protein
MWGIAMVWCAVNAALGASRFISEHPAFNRAFVLGAPILFVIAFAGSASLRAWAFAFDTRTLIAAQALRVGGIAFLAVHAVGKLDGTFAWWAGSLDCAVGFSALFVASYLTPVRTAWQRNLLIAWMVPGILDFLVAIPLAMTARLHDAASRIALTRPPLSMIASHFVPLALTTTSSSAHTSGERTHRHDFGVRTPSMVRERLNADSNGSGPT